MQTFEPLISVFLPTFARCGGGHLERAIRSVLSQTYQNLELFVVDDGSVDGSKEVIEHFCAEDSRVKQFRFEINTGLPAYNTGICYAKCRGSCLAWIFDDCVWRMHHLEVLVRELSASPSAGFVYSKALSHFAGGNEVVIGMPYDEKHMQKGNNHIANVATLVTRKAVEAVGWYDPHVILKRFCDWDLWTRIWKVFGCAFVDEITADEYGTGLADSLGNTHTLFPSVILKYAATERNAMLVPSRLKEYNPFRNDFASILTTKEIENVDYLIMEHFVRTLDIERIIKAVSKRIEREGAEDSLLEKIHRKNNTVDDDRLKLLCYGLARYYEQKTELISMEKAQMHGALLSMSSIDEFGKMRKALEVLKTENVRLKSALQESEARVRKEE